MKIIKDLGTRFPKPTYTKKVRFLLVECPICKKHFETRSQYVKDGRTTKCRSCAARNQMTKHGLSRTKIYKLWSLISKRCSLNINNKYFKNYSSRGIKVCDEWKNDFKSFYDWALANGYREGLTIDRIDNDGDYEPNNCRFVNRNIQNRNTRRIQRNNTSGYRGVSFHKKAKKWTARITVDNKSKYLGIFENPKQAASAYDAFVIEHNLEHTRNFQD